MISSIITIFLVGLIAGFIFAMPIAGPISIIIASNALKGNIKFCIRTALGASIIEFVYVLVAVLGLSALISLYSPLIPYMLLVGSFFLLVIGVKITRTNIKLDEIEFSKRKKLNIEKKGGLRTGIIINLTNPSFFFGILTSSFLVLSFASSIGLNTGGLDLLVQENVTSFQEITGEEISKIDTSFTNKNSIEQTERSSYTLLLSFLYAFSLGSGGFIWLVILSKLLVKYRNKIKVEILNFTIRTLGITLCGIGLYLLWKSFIILFF
jgi:threonine/homoserine/homoserine lactone efflux protein